MIYEPRIYYVSELFLNKRDDNALQGVRNWYKITVPWEHFYRDGMKLSAFFHGLKRKKYYRSWTDKRHLYLYRPDELESWKRQTERLAEMVNKPVPEFKILKEFARIDDFFDYIGYDRKAQKYLTGEKMVLYKHWKE
jgi:hypothetical protein